MNMIKQMGLSELNSEPQIMLVTEQRIFNAADHFIEGYNGGQWKWLIPGFWCLDTDKELNIINSENYLPNDGQGVDTVIASLSIFSMVLNHTLWDMAENPERYNDVSVDHFVNHYHKLRAWVFSDNSIFSQDQQTFFYKFTD